MLRGTTNMPRNIHTFSPNVKNIRHYPVEYWQSRKTLLWIWIMLWMFKTLEFSFQKKKSTFAVFKVVRSPENLRDNKLRFLRRFGI